MGNTGKRLPFRRINIKEAEFVTTKWITRIKTAAWILLAAVLCLMNLKTIYADTVDGQAT